MNVIVTDVFMSDTEKLKAKGWRFDESQEHGAVLGLDEYRRLCGAWMSASFASMREAMREFEETTGIDVIACTDHGGARVHYFICREENIVVGGWDCGKYLFDKWAETPRQALEAWNAEAPHA